MPIRPFAVLENTAELWKYPVLYDLRGFRATDRVGQFALFCLCSFVVSVTDLLRGSGLRKTDSRVTFDPPRYRNAIEMPAGGGTMREAGHWSAWESDLRVGRERQVPEWSNGRAWKALAPQRPGFECAVLLSTIHYLPISGGGDRTPAWPERSGGNPTLSAICPFRTGFAAFCLPMGLGASLVSGCLASMRTVDGQNVGNALEIGLISVADALHLNQFRHGGLLSDPSPYHQQLITVALQS